MDEDDGETLRAKRDLGGWEGGETRPRAGFSAIRAAPRAKLYRENAVLSLYAKKMGTFV